MPFRCASCGWHGWGRDYGRHKERMVGREPVGPEPDLRAIDRVVSGLGR